MEWSQPLPEYVEGSQVSHLQAVKIKKSPSSPSPRPSSSFLPVLYSYKFYAAAAGNEPNNDQRTDDVWTDRGTSNDYLIFLHWFFFPYSPLHFLSAHRNARRRGTGISQKKRKEVEGEKPARSGTSE
jgi:hypothetical protein